MRWLSSLLLSIDMFSGVEKSLRPESLPPSERVERTVGVGRIHWIQRTVGVAWVERTIRIGWVHRIVAVHRVILSGMLPTCALRRQPTQMHFATRSTKSASQCLLIAPHPLRKAGGLNVCSAWPVVVAYEATNHRNTSTILSASTVCRLYQRQLVQILPVSPATVSGHPLSSLKSALQRGRGPRIIRTHTHTVASTVTNTAIQRHCAGEAGSVLEEALPPVRLMPRLTAFGGFQPPGF